jgi:AraC-like DNA-binding protein
MASDYDAPSDLLDDAADALVERGATDQSPDGWGRFAAIIVNLLESAGRTLASNREAAIASIVRASALLRAERDRQASGAKAASGLPTRGGLASWQIRRVSAYVDANLESTIRSRDLARIARLSTGHFARAFRASMGATPTAFVVRHRVEQAQHRMLATDEPLCQIALACGFCGQAHFSRVFRRVVGISPNMWRRQWLAGRRPGPGLMGGGGAAGKPHDLTPDVVAASAMRHGP